MTELAGTQKQYCADHPNHSGAGNRRSRGRAIVLGLMCMGFGAAVAAEEIGHVDTVWKMIGPDHKIKIEAFDDEKIQGVTCHVSRAVTGGISGAVGLAEDTSDASIACRQVGPVAFKGKLKFGEEVFKERRSLMFKSLQVVRFCDEKRNTLVYLVYSDKVVEGSPKNAISTVPLTVWAGGEPPPRCDDGRD